MNQSDIFPKVCVLLPVYNGEAFIRGAIESIQAQTFSKWKMLIVNDGSTDKTLEICEEYARRDPRISIYSNVKNIGLARTMNRLIELAKLENIPYLAIQEADDYSVPERFELEVAVLDSQPDVGLVSGVAEWVEELGGDPLNYFPGMLLKGKQFPENKVDLVAFLYIEQSKVVNAACMFRRSAVVKISPPFDPDAKMSIDWQFFVHLAHHWRFYGLSNVLIQARRGSARTSLTSKKDLQFYEARRCIRLLYYKYKNDKSSPINYFLYRTSMSTQLIIEGRYFFENQKFLARIKGVGLIFGALAYDPSNRKGWNSLLEFFQRFLRKLSVTF